jgi:hypothetical protein
MAAPLLPTLPPLIVTRAIDAGNRVGSAEAAGPIGRHAGLAGLFKLRAKLAGRKVGIMLSGGNIDRETPGRVLRSGPGQRERLGVVE